MEKYLNVLSICSGVGGLDLGLKLALPEARTLLYVEREAFACAVLAARMEDGSLDPAPIWPDIESFDGSGFAGLVDCVIAGLPCQPFSVAGKRLGEKDGRYIWPDFFRVLREVRAPFVFLENVPGILKFFQPIGQELSRMGYDFKAGLFSAEEVGASHKRERFFCLAHFDRFDEVGRIAEFLKTNERWSCSESGGSSGILADTTGYVQTRDHSRTLANDLGSGLEERESKPSNLGEECSPAERDGLPLFPPGPGDIEAWRRILERWSEVAPALSIAEEDTAGIRYGFAARSQVVKDKTQSPLRRVSDGTAHRLDRLRALGNAVVPETAALAFISLSKSMMRLQNTENCDDQG